MAVTKKVEREYDFNFWHIEVDVDTWAKIACVAKRGELWLNTTPYDKICVNDIIVFGLEGNPYPKCICRVRKADWHRGFKSGFKSTIPTVLGYIMAEQLRATYHDYADNYAVNEVRKYGVMLVEWDFISCEYIKRDKETDYGVVRKDIAKNGVREYDPEFDPEDEAPVEDSEQYYQEMLADAVAATAPVGKGEVGARATTREAKRAAKDAMVESARQARLAEIAAERAAAQGKDIPGETSDEEEEEPGGSNDMAISEPAAETEPVVEPTEDNTQEVKQDGATVRGAPAEV